MSKQDQIGNMRGLYLRIRSKIAAALAAAKSYTDNAVASIRPDHEVDTTRISGKVVITKDGSSYAVSAEQIVKPDSPTLTKGQDFYNTLSVTMSAVSGSVIYYTTDGSTPTTSSLRYTSPITIGSIQDESTDYTIKAIAVKNGMVSDVESQDYTCYRKIATPTFASATGNKYSASRTITFACATAGVRIFYRIGSGDWVSGTSVTITTAEPISIQAQLRGWVDSDTNTNGYTLNAPKCYIGQAASVTTVADIKALANSYERDTMVGWTAPTIDFGSTTEYVWFAIPSTAAKNLTIKSNGFGVTLDNTAGTVIGAYRVWRTANKINSSFTFDFS